MTRRVETSEGEEKNHTLFNHLDFTHANATQYFLFCEFHHKFY